MKKIILTGAHGFVGSYFQAYNKGRYLVKTLSLRDDTWKTEDLAGYDAVVHLAGKAHEMKAVDGQVYFDVNRDLTRELFEKAAAAGIPHFIYASSTKVYGDNITGVLDEQSPYNAGDAYGRSKQEAEELLLAHQSAIRHIAVVRPPLVYGPGVKGNMINLLRLCAKRWPLPFGKIHNRRSMVYVGNLAALINTIIDRQATGIFVAGDAAPVSTTELVTYIRAAMNRKPGLIAVPRFVRSILKKIKPALHTRLFGSFEVDNSYTCTTLAFVPPFTTATGITDMVNWYINEQQAVTRP